MACWQCSAIPLHVRIRYICSLKIEEKNKNGCHHYTNTKGLVDSQVLTANITLSRSLAFELRCPCRSLFKALSGANTGKVVRASLLSSQELQATRVRFCNSSKTAEPRWTSSFLAMSSGPKPRVFSSRCLHINIRWLSSPSITVNRLRLEGNMDL